MRANQRTSSADPTYIPTIRTLRNAREADTTEPLQRFHDINHSLPRTAKSEKNTSGLRPPEKTYAYRTSKIAEKSNKNAEKNLLCTSST